MGRSLRKAGRTSLCMTPEDQVALGGSSTLTRTPHLIPSAPPVALKPTTFFEVKGVKLQQDHNVKF